MCIDVFRRAFSSLVLKYRRKGIAVRATLSVRRTLASQPLLCHSVHRYTATPQPCGFSPPASVTLLRRALKRLQKAVTGTISLLDITKLRPYSTNPRERQSCSSISYRETTTVLNQESLPNQARENTFSFLSEKETQADTRSKKKTLLVLS